MHFTEYTWTPKERARYCVRTCRSSTRPCTTGGVHRDERRADHKADPTVAVHATALTVRKIGLRCDTGSAASAALALLAWPMPRPWRNRDQGGGSQHLDDERRPFALAGDKVGDNREGHKDSCD